MNPLDAWRACSAALRAEVSNVSAAGSSQQNFCCLIQELNEYSYPVDGLSASVSFNFHGLGKKELKLYLIFQPPGGA